MGHARYPDTETRQTSVFEPMKREDWALVALVSLLLFAVCIARSRSRLLWADELYSYRLLSAPTLGGTLRGWREGADGGGLFYYVLGRLWTGLFGLSELTLRLFSTAGMCAALGVTWTAARRYFGTFAVALSIGIAYLTPAVMLWQELNGRFYGLFLASAALSSLLFLLAAEEPPKLALLIGLAIAHALLVGSHILGLVYSFSLIAGMVALDSRFRRLRPGVYLAALSGWIVLPFSYRAIRNSSGIATNAFWTHKPDLLELAGGLAVLGRLTAWLLCAALIAAAIGWLVRLRRGASETEPFLPLAPAYLVVSLFLAELLLFLKSHFGISIFADRYLVPLSVALVLIFAASLTRVLPRSVLVPSCPSKRFWYSLIALLPLAAYSLSRKVNFSLYPHPGYPERLSAKLPLDAPVLVTIPGFDLLSHYDPDHHYLFMLDWPYDLSPANAGVDYSGERLMENWKRAGYESGQILPCTEIFTRYADVTLLLDLHRVAWFHDRLVPNPSFEIRKLGEDTEWDPYTIWRIRRIHPGPPPC